MIRITDAILPVGHPSRPGGSYRKTTVTIHETGNRSVGADAYNHALYARNRTDKLGVHYYVDDQSIYRTIPDNEAANHCGSTTGNRYSIAIEICVNPDSDFRKACENAAELSADLLREWGLTQESLRQHYDWNKKNCPENLRRSGWTDFVALVERHLTKGEAAMVYSRVLKPVDIQQVKPVMGLNNKPEPIESIKARTGAHIVLNGGTFGMTAPYPVDSSLTIDRKVYADRYTGFGIAFNGNRFAWSYKNSQGWPDFIGAYSTLIRNGQKEISLPLNTKDGRTAVGITAAGELVLYVVGKNDPAICTTSELSDRMTALGCENAINLDGSYSSQITAPDKIIDSSRNVLWYICIWLTPAALKAISDETDNDDTDLGFYTAKATERMSVYDSNGRIETGRRIDKGDVCKIGTEVTVNLLIRVEYPVIGGLRTAYVKSLDGFVRV